MHRRGRSMISTTYPRVEGIDLVAEEEGRKEGRNGINMAATSTALLAIPT
jgi:hypothetical protein